MGEMMEDFPKTFGDYNFHFSKFRSLAINQFFQASIHLLHIHHS